MIPSVSEHHYPVACILQVTFASTRATWKGHGLWLLYLYQPLVGDLKNDVVSFGGLPKMGGYPGTPTAAWFILEIPLKMDDLGRTPFSGNLYFDVTCFFSTQRTEWFAQSTRNGWSRQQFFDRGIEQTSGFDQRWVSGWWFGTMEFYDFPYIYIVGISSSQLTFIFFRGVETTNQTNYGQEYSVAPFWGPEIPTGNSRPPDGVACGGPADLWDWKKTKAQRSADTFPVRVRG